MERVDSATNEKIEIIEYVDIEYEYQREQEAKERRGEVNARGATAEARLGTKGMTDVQRDAPQPIAGRPPGQSPDQLPPIS